MSLLSRISGDLFIFDSMNYHARKHRKACIECLISCEDHGITLKKYYPKMFYPLRMMNENFFDTLEKREFTWENHLLKVTTKSANFIPGLKVPNVSFACIIVFLFQQ